MFEGQMVSPMTLPLDFANILPLRLFMAAAPQRWPYVYAPRLVQGRASSFFSFFWALYEA